MKRRVKGEGSIFQRTNGLWAAQITLPSGKKKVKYSRTQKVVRDWLTDQKKLLNDGMLVEDTNLTFGAFLDRFVTEVVASRCKAHTTYVYSYLLNKHVKPHLGDVKLSKLRADQLQSLYHDLSLKDLSKGTIRNIHRILKHALKYALKWGLIIRNVADAVDPPSYRRKAPQVWTKEQTQLFLKEIEGSPIYPMILLVVSTGIRKGEACGLTWSAVDFERNTIQVRQSAQFVNGVGMVLSAPKTDRGRRLIVVPAYVMEELKAHKQIQDDWKKQAPAWHEMDLVFPNRNGEPRHETNLRREWQRVIKESGLPYIRFHDLRHTHATLLLLAGVNPKIVQERLGHSSVQLTLDTYTQVLPGLQEEAADKIGLMLKPV